MSDSLISLLKVPITGVTIVCGLLAAKILVGIPVHNIASAGPDGVVFDTTRDAISAIEADMKNLLVRVDGLEKSSASAPVVSYATEKTESVSQPVAALFEPSLLSSEAQKSADGYIWIGNFDDSWDRMRLERLDGTPVTTPPTELVVGTKFNVLGNMSLREGLPPDTPEYYRATKRLGVVPSGTAVVLKETPVGIDRGGVIQYWAKVQRVAENP